jgi:reactive chlorine resistance protein C
MSVSISDQSNQLAQTPGRAFSATLRALASHLMRVGLVVIIAWFGAFKYTAAEAHAIEPLLANSPLLRWLYDLTDLQGASRLIGSAELVIAVLIALRPLAPKLSAAGSLAAVGMFSTTLSFLVTTPGVWVQVDGFLIPNETGSFLLKDLFLLGAALWTASDAIEASRHTRPSPASGSRVASA